MSKRTPLKQRLKNKFLKYLLQVESLKLKRREKGRKRLTVTTGTKPNIFMESFPKQNRLLNQGGCFFKSKNKNRTKIHSTKPTQIQDNSFKIRISASEVGIAMKNLFKRLYVNLEKVISNLWAMTY